MAARGIDVEALSPRDANARPRVNDLKAKPAAQLKANKEKEYPPPPPPNVAEPPSADRRDGAVYQVGNLLGKGGFAVCYEGRLAGTRKQYALKIVKSKMPAKMEQKVSPGLVASAQNTARLTRKQVSNRAPDSFIRLSVEV